MEIQIKKLEKSVNVDFDSLPEVSKAYVIAYGLKQTLNDSIASGQNNAEREAKLGQRLDALIAGTVGQRATSVIVNPIEKEAIAIVRALLRKKFGQKISKELLDEKAKLLSTDPRIVAQATKVVTARKEAAGLQGLELEI